MEKICDRWKGVGYFTKYTIYNEAWKVSKGKNVTKKCRGNGRDYKCYFSMTTADEVGRNVMLHNENYKRNVSDKGCREN